MPLLETVPICKFYKNSTEHWAAKVITYYILQAMKSCTDFQVSCNFYTVTVQKCNNYAYLHISLQILIIRNIQSI